MAERAYTLERLYEDQEPDLVADTIPAVLAWLGPSQGGGALPLSFEVRRGADKKASSNDKIVLRWDERKLERRSAGTLARAQRMRSRKTAEREHVTQLAAYGLTFVGISIWMPGRRAITFREGLPPDILFDDTAGAVRGVEASGRASGGFGALRVVLEGSEREPAGKRAQLVARADVVEAHVALWCAQPRVSMLLQVKP